MKKLLYFLILIINNFNTLASLTQVSGGEAIAQAFMADSNDYFMVAGVATAGVWRSFNGGLDWEAINDSIFSEPYLTHPYLSTHDINFLDDNGDTIIISTIQYINYPVTYGSRTYKSIDRGESWQLIYDNFMSSGSSNDPEFLIVDYQNHNKMYYINNYYFGYSENFGQTWNSSIINNYSYEKHGLNQIENALFYTSSFFWFSSTGGYGGLCKSIDNGQNWVTMIDFYSEYSLNYAVVESFIKLSNGDWIVPLSWTSPVMWETQNLLVSTNQGQTWNRIGDGLPPRYQPKKIVEDPEMPGRLFIIGYQKYGVYYSDDYGINWNRCLNGLPENVAVCYDLEVNRNNGEIYVTVGSWGIYKTCDHGLSWIQIPMPPVGNNGFLSIFNNTVFCQDNGFRNWRLDFPNNYLTEMSFPLSPDTLVMPELILYKSNDTLVNGIWKRPVNNPTDHFQLAYSYDNGENWILSSFLNFLPYSYINVYFDSNMIRFVSNNSSRDTVFISYDLGYNWTDSPFPDLVTRFAQNETDIFISSISQIYRYDNPNNNWISLNYTGPFIGSILGIISSDIYISTFEQENSHCYRYSNGQWTLQGLIGSDITNSVIFPLEINYAILAVKSNTNVILISYDYGVTWNELDCEFPYPTQTYAFYDLKYDSYRNRIWASTGAGLCYINIDELSVDSIMVKFYPAEVYKLNASPNPFNPSTTLSYSFPISGEISLTIYDIQGREVSALFEGYRAAGDYQAVFDGSQLASGIYFAVLQVGEYRQAQKLVLIK